MSTRLKIENRRRTGCWMCKTKHIQCTEEKPSCRRCIRLGLGCEYGIRLLWREDAAQRNISLGREGKWSKKSKMKISKSEPGGRYQPIDLRPYMGMWVFLNASKENFELHRRHDLGDEKTAVGEREDENPPALRNETLEMVISQPDGILPINEILSLEGSPMMSRFSFDTFSAFSSIEGNLFSYFVNSIGPSCSLSPSQNPYLAYLTPMSFQFPALRDALIAASANQLRLLNDKRFEREALSYKNKAIRAVQRAIDAEEIDVGIVATVLMLCFYDISDGCNRSWVAHLRGGISLLDKLSGYTTTYRGSNTEDSLHAFLRMYFVAHEIMSRTACEEDIAGQVYEWAEHEALDEIDVLMGCSRELMTLIRRTSILASQLNQLLQYGTPSDFELSALAASRDNIERALHSLHQILPISASKCTKLASIAETKRLTALLYLHERLCPLPSTSNSGDRVSAHNPQPKIICQIISLIKRLPDSPTLLWPLFMLGNVKGGLDEEQRRFVHDRLTALQRVRNLGSVRRARVCVEETWMRSDLRPGESNLLGRVKNGSGVLISLA
ncbi:Fungal specific transcription factor domain containing protein [Hyaloscypha variabilis]